MLVPTTRGEDQDLLVLAILFGALGCFAFYTGASRALRGESLLSGGSGRTRFYSQLAGIALISGTTACFGMVYAYVALDMGYFIVPGAIALTAGLAVGRDNAARMSPSQRELRRREGNLMVVSLYLPQAFMLGFVAVVIGLGLVGAFESRANGIGFIAAGAALVLVIVLYPRVSKWLTARYSIGALRSEHLQRRQQFLGDVKDEDVLLQAFGIEEIGTFENWVETAQKFSEERFSGPRGTGRLVAALISLCQKGSVEPLNLPFDGNEVTVAEEFDPKAVRDFGFTISPAGLDRLKSWEGRDFPLDD